MHVFGCQVVALEQATPSDAPALTVQGPSPGDEVQDGFCWVSKASMDPARPLSSFTEVTSDEMRRLATLASDGNMTAYVPLRSLPSQCRVLVGWRYAGDTLALCVLTAAMILASVHASYGATWE